MLLIKQRGSRYYGLEYICIPSAILLDSFKYRVKS